MITSVSNVQPAFRGRISNNMMKKMGDFLQAQSRHLFVQGASFAYGAKYLGAFESFDAFVDAKILIDLGEYLSNLMLKNPNTNSKQCTNIFSAATDCTKDVIRWVKKLSE